MSAQPSTVAATLEARLAPLAAVVARTRPTTARSTRATPAPRAAAGTFP